MSQSLWNRAGSFDQAIADFAEEYNVSIPLEQGGVFRQFLASIKERQQARLNPFGTGRGLST